jgi:predicted DNA-binding transcriptional regulator AlpA
MPDRPEARQMCLAIETEASFTAARSCQVRRRRTRDLGMDPIVYMNDVVRIVGRHRSTILRWIERKRFPAKSVPRDHPSGWLRSEIESWQRGEHNASPDRSPLLPDHADEGSCAPMLKE